MWCEKSIINRRCGLTVIEIIVQNFGANAAHKNDCLMIIQVGPQLYDFKINYIKYSNFLSLKLTSICAKTIPILLYNSLE